MARNFNELREQMTPEQKAKADEYFAEMVAELPLNELRRARALTQESVAERLGSKQGSVSKLERRADMYLSTLRRYIEAMGGELEIVARFPEGSVRITRLAEA